MNRSNTPFQFHHAFFKFYFFDFDVVRMRARLKKTIVNNFCWQCSKCYPKSELLSLEQIFVDDNFRLAENRIDHGSARNSLVDICSANLQ